MQIVGAFQAKTYFSSLLEQVEKGEQITITKHGRPVARLVPVTGTNQENIKTVIQRFKEMAQWHSLGRLDWKQLRDEGGENNGIHFVDASIALAWCFGDESTPQTIALLERLEKETAKVPVIWPLEISNILLSAQRRNRITYADMIQYLEMFKTINIQIDRETVEKSFHDIISLAYSEHLTSYDAAYLELALEQFAWQVQDRQLQEAGQN